MSPVDVCVQRREAAWCARPSEALSEMSRPSRALQNAKAARASADGKSAWTVPGGSLSLGTLPQHGVWVGLATSQVTAHQGGEGVLGWGLSLLEFAH